MKKQYLYRSIIYICGLLSLALGLTLNTKTGLGVTPIISVSFCISDIWHLNFGNMTFILYGIFIFIEMILHILSGDKIRNKKLTLIMDLLQFPFSLVFTRFLNIFSLLIPNFETDYPGKFAGSFTGRILVLALAIILTGIGVSLSLNMRLIPNPGDGIVQAIADYLGKKVGITKNCFDLFNVIFTVIVSIVFAGHLIGIGIGTVAAVICVGRVVEITNRLTKDKITKIAGINSEK